MLKSTIRRSSTRSGGHFAIVASRYNARYVDALLRAARRELVRGGAESIRVVRVPGAFEIPVVAAALAGAGEHPPGVILCLGVIFQGETTHAQHIGDAVSRALVELQIRHQLPVIHGVYHFHSEAQAKARCLGRSHNRGIELARTALDMVQVMARLRGRSDNLQRRRGVWPVQP